MREELLGWLAGACEGECGHGDCFGVGDELDPAGDGAVRVAVGILAEQAGPAPSALLRRVCSGCSACIPAQISAPRPLRH